MAETRRVKRVCMDADEIERSLTRMAHEILERNKGAGNVALVGIVTRGDLIAKHLADKMVTSKIPNLLFCFTNESFLIKFSNFQHMQ